MEIRLDYEYASLQVVVRELSPLLLVLGTRFTVS